MEIKMNELRTKVIDTLKKSQTPLTLNEISEIIGTEIKTGTTNAMVSANLIKKVGVKKVAVVSYREVATYEIGDLSLLEKKDN